MKKANKKLLKGLERVLRSEAVNGIDGFPPPCAGILHQPKRPVVPQKREVGERSKIYEEKN